jgi:CubicO group peptidase (beta-lactamase class C family)
MTQADMIQRALEIATERGEQGVQVAAYVDGELVVDAWIGDARPGGPPVDGDTLFPVFSVTKAVTSTALHVQAERGYVDYEQPVATYWPEFAANGKESLTVRHVLSHQSGIPQMPDGVTPERLADWDWMTQRVAEFTPMFEPGTSSAYQSLVYGWIIGEVVRRTDPQGRDFGRFVQEEICEPLQIRDLYVGLPESEFGRVAELSSIMPPGRVENETEISIAAKPDAVALEPRIHNLDVVKRACYPGAGGIMTARAGARVFAMLANGGVLDGVRMLSEERVRSFTTPRPNGELLDQVLLGGNRVAPRIGNSGYWLAGSVFGAGPGVIHHGGAGTSQGFADMDRRLGAVIFHNRMFEGFAPDSEAHPFRAIADAVLEIADRRVGGRA